MGAGVRLVLGALAVADAAPQRDRPHRRQERTQSCSLQGSSCIFTSRQKSLHSAAQPAPGTGYPAQGLGTAREPRASSARSAPCLSFPICNGSIAGGGNKSRRPAFCGEEAPYAIGDNVNTKTGVRLKRPSVTQREEGVSRLGLLQDFPFLPPALQQLPAAGPCARQRKATAGARRPPAPPWSSPS